MMRGIVLYDYLHCRGGAEQVTLELARGFPGTEICVSTRDHDVFSDAMLGGIRCIDLTHRNIPRFRAGRIIECLYLFSRRLGFLNSYDWATFSGSFALLAVANRAASTNIYYCHTLPRLAYDLKDYYLATLPWWQRPAFNLLTRYIRKRYESALTQMNVLIANSQNVRRRLQRYVGRDAVVIHPPCDTEGFRWIDQGDYYLSTSRLEPYKRVDRVVSAFRNMPDKKLVVTSGGSDDARVRRIANGAANISFTGWVDDGQLKQLVGRAIATVYVPKDEDFGMSPVESMAAGKPVIGVADGGLLETVVSGITGLLIASECTEGDIIAAVRKLTPAVALEMRSACEQRAIPFSRERFLFQMRELIESVSGSNRTS